MTSNQSTPHFEPNRDTPDFKIGKPIAARIQISEPWDFQIPEGGNIVSGRILRMSGQGAIFKADQILEDESRRSAILVLLIRYHGDAFDVSPGMHRETVGMGLCFGDDFLTQPFAEIERNSHYAFIGGVMYEVE